MKTPAVFIFLLSVILFKGSRAEPYEYLQFVLQYARGSCYNDKYCILTSRLPAKFTIHGLWPSNISNFQVECKQAVKQHSFNQTLIMTTSLQTDLDRSWPSVRTSKNNMKFWEDEYNKHGSCTAPAITQKAYFERAHALWNEYDIYTVLDQEKIKPKNNYQLSKFEAAVKTKIGTDKTPLILCKKGQGIRLILREIVICFDHQGTNPVNCTRKTDCLTSPNQNMSAAATNSIYYV